jgi:large subunit ribosomal protein L15
MPLQRRIPKRGFKNFTRVEYQPVNVRDLNRIEAGEVTPETMKAHGLIGTLKKPVKVLGTGEVAGAYRVSAHAFSAAARSKIEGAGGSVAVLGHPVADEEVESAVASASLAGGETPETEDEKA